MKPILRGALAAHPLAPAFAEEVARVHRRYAAEVVERNRLCPFLRDPDAAFGHFCVVLDSEPDAARAFEIARELRSAGGGVAHLVFPLVGPPSKPFERFGSELGRRIREGLPDPPVIATFHPELSGNRATPHGLVGLLRHAPDPFVQLVPAGLHEGGTVLAGASPGPGRDVAEENWNRLGPEGIEAVLALTEALRRERNERYAPFLEALLPASR